MYKDIETIETTVTDLQAVKNSIKNIILTPKGSLPGRPKFGSEFYKVPFSQMDHLTEVMARNYAQEALDVFEDRIIVDDIIIKKVEEFNKLVVDIHFSYTDDTLNTIQESVAISLNV